MAKHLLYNSKTNLHSHKNSNNINNNGRYIAIKQFENEHRMTRKLLAQAVLFIRMRCGHEPQKCYLKKLVNSTNAITNQRINSAAIV